MWVDEVDPEDVGGIEQHRRGSRVRSERVEDLRAKLAAALARQPADPDFASGAEALDELDVEERNMALRGLLACVVVKAAGRGRRVAIADRVRVLRHDARIALPQRRGGIASDIVTLDWPGDDDEAVLGPVVFKSAA